MSPEDVIDEYKEVEHELEKASSPNEDIEMDDASLTKLTPLPPRQKRRCLMLRRFVSPVFVESFVLIFLAEWGDRSQMTTIILAATKVRKF